MWGSSFSGGHVIQVAAHDSRVNAVVSQAGAMDVNQIIRMISGPETFAGLQQLALLERIRHATEGGEKYIPSTGRPGEGFALQSDQDSYDFAHQAQATVAPAWRMRVSSLLCDIFVRSEMKEAASEGGLNFPKLGTISNALLVRKLVGENVNPVNFRRFGEQVARFGFFHQGRRHFAIQMRIAPSVVVERIKNCKSRRPLLNSEPRNRADLSVYQGYGGT